GVTAPALQAALELPGAAPAGPRLVEVAVDAAGGGGARSYTYSIPEALADLVPGEAVLVEFGRRQALGIVLGDGAESPAGVKPVLDRVRADGPLLPPLTLALARSIAAHYLAPPSIVIRSMLPPAMLERLELVAERGPDAASPGDDGRLAPEDLDLLEQLEARPRHVRDLASAEGRAGLVRRLRALAGRGLVTLDWTLTRAGAGPRFERWLTIETAGQAALETFRRGESWAGRPLGERQLELLAELERRGDAGVSASELAGAPLLSAVASLIRRGLITSDVRERPRVPLARRPIGRRGARPSGSELSQAQALAVETIARAIMQREATPILLDGVTGSGKTAIYVEALSASLAAGRPALVLVPEIALAMPLIDRIRADLAASIATLHSALGEGERADEWRRIRSGVVDVVIGTRLALAAPLGDLGLIVVDEEHDPAYKSDRSPRVQARDAAIRLGDLAGAAVVLGSATPSVESFGRARDGVYRSVILAERLSGAHAAVEVVDLRAELAAGNRGLLSERLVRALARLDRDAGDRAILVLNRRGSASAVLCRDCGTAQSCPECSRPLVFHQVGMTLRCHHCGTASPLATRCPACGSPRIRYLGGGTQRVEAELRTRFPGLRVGRLDRDVVERKGAAERVVDAFTEGRLDVLVGTSLVTKGLDIPEVTLVGVVSADVALNLPDERAAERTYQLLAQAVGRAGRGERPGLAIIQSYQPEHPAIQSVARGDARAFYDAELEQRRRFGSPPFGQLVKLTVGLADREGAEREGRAMVERLRARAQERGQDVDVIGPAPAYIARRADRWRFNVILRGERPVELLDGSVDPPWSVDVDPESLL
ncbi:MAG: primosomal protein N', partial [Chloroflexi bacterium]